MSVNLVIAVTDGDWFNTLRQQTDLTEVNFWAPSGRNFQALRPGELFLFKLHAPYNYIVGGGIFTYANQLPCSLAWKAFGVANGAQTEEEMRSRILRLRRENSDNRADFTIGCRILTQPFFFPKADWIPVPKSWSPNIVTLKTYNTGEGEGLALWKAVMERLNLSDYLDQEGGQERFGKPQKITPRLGQGAFRILVTDTYERRCAITRERTLPALEAAHIRPFSIGGEHDASNGLLLRSDIHSLFDEGYVTVTKEHRFEVSKKIKEEFDNGREYYKLDGETIFLPKKVSQRPDPDLLQWHNDSCFRG